MSPTHLWRTGVLARPAQFTLPFEVENVHYLEVRAVQQHHVSANQHMNALRGGGGSRRSSSCGHGYIFSRKPAEACRARLAVSPGPGAGGPVSLSPVEDDRDAPGTSLACARDHARCNNERSHELRNSCLSRPCPCPWPWPWSSSCATAAPQPRTKAAATPRCNQVLTRINTSQRMRNQSSLRPTTRHARQYLSGNSI